VSEPGRNEPCPCGSGRKYKRCCLARAETVTAAASTAEERRSAQAALGQFGMRREFEEEREAAEGEFWDDALDVLTEDEEDEIGEQGDAYFLEWFVVDCRLAGGQTPLELFLEREGRRLRPGERRYLERARATHLRLYEVLDVRLDEGLDLLDLWDETRISVRERLATRQLVRWDVLGARVTRDHDDVPVIDGTPYLYPALAKDAMLTDLRRGHRRYRKRVPGDDTEFFKASGPMFFQWWIEHAVLASRMRIRTPEGDDVVLARAVFDVLDAAALERALASHPALVRGAGASYTWLEPESADGFRRNLGMFMVEPSRLVLETPSKARAERGRALLESIAGGAVRYRATSLESVEQVLQRQPPPASPDVDAVPKEIAAQMAQAFYERHYRGWVDTPLPALSGKTPRAAAASKSGRPRVVALIKEMETRAARQRLAGEPAYDFGWMWGELGLERPEPE